MVRCTAAGVPSWSVSTSYGALPVLATLLLPVIFAPSRAPTKKKLACCLLSGRTCTTSNSKHTQEQKNEKLARVRMTCRRTPIQTCCRQDVWAACTRRLSGIRPPENNTNCRGNGLHFGEWPKPTHRCTRAIGSRMRGRRRERYQGRKLGGPMQI